MLTPILAQPTVNATKEQDMLAIKDTATRPASGLRLKNTKVTAEKLDSVAQDFEAQFVSQMLSNMFSTVDPSESLGGSDTEEVYQSMLVNEYGKIIARTGGVGIADQVKHMMLQQQEVE
jgi:flagellar protein FlgJ